MLLSHLSCRISESGLNAQIRKGIAGKIAIELGDLETLNFTTPKVGYMLNVGKESVNQIKCMAYPYDCMV